MSTAQEFPNFKPNDNPGVWRLSLIAGEYGIFFNLSLILCVIKIKVTFNELGVRR